MYRLNPAKKDDPALRWALPDRVFFGHGACHILAGVFLQEFPEQQLFARWIKPSSGEWEGNHIYVSNGEHAFDYHGCSVEKALVAHHFNKWESIFAGWKAEVLAVDFDLLDTASLNERGMRGPDQFLNDPVERARQFIERKRVFMHLRCYAYE